jgi:JNK_SAPK-associated protein-1
MPRFLPMMSESASNSIQDVSVVDVYDLASDIGKECEKIIDAYGTESVQVKLNFIKKSLIELPHFSH